MTDRLSNQGYADVLVGLQYGDEGKAKVTDRIAQNYDVVARFNGGANAGHSVENDQGQKLALNQVPSGVFYPDKTLYIGSGCVVNITKLLNEIHNIISLKIDLSGRLHISPYATVIQPHHIVLDQEMGKEIGTTGNGIGPAYADRAYRIRGKNLLNVRVGDLSDDKQVAGDIMMDNLRYTLELFKRTDIEPAQMLQEVRSSIENIEEFIEQDTQFMIKQVREGAKILFEGAQSFMLDVAKGTVPYVTSSNTEAGSAFVGGDLPPNYHRKTIGVGKAVMTRVGRGPFVSEFGGQQSEDYSMEDGGKKYVKTVESELYNAEELLQSDDPFYVSIALRMLGHEYGVVTKRPRRMGALDLVQLRHAVQANGVDEVYLTKCDVLRDFTRTKIGKIPLVVGYQVNGKDIDYVPASEKATRLVSPVVEYHEGFSEDIGDIAHFENLPENLQDLLEKVSHFAGGQVQGVGTGPRRSQLLERE